MAANPFEYDPQKFVCETEFPTCIISYATESNGGKGQEIMFAIAQVLRKCGITSFNGCQVSPGEQWKSEWLGRVPEAKVGIVILSPEYFRSVSCQKECMELLKEEKVKIVPIQCGMPNTSGRFLGKSSQQIKNANFIKQNIGNYLPPPDCGSFMDNWEKNVRQLVDLIKKHISGEASEPEDTKEHDTNNNTSKTGQAHEQIEEVSVGIDLGTSYSCVGIWNNNTNDVDIIVNNQGQQIIPSYVAFHATGRVIGDDAKNNISSNGMNTVFDAQRLFDYFDGTPLDLNSWPFRVVLKMDGMPVVVVTFKGEERSFTPQEITAMILTKMKQTAEKATGKKVANAFISVPAHFNYAQSRAIKDAASIAGLEFSSVLSSASATGITYMLKNHKDSAIEKTILIFDLGGGTLDVGIYVLEESIIEARATSGSNGSNCLGGQFFDKRMVDHFLAEIRRKFNTDLTDNKRALSRLHLACECAKRTLSTRTIAHIDIPLLFNDIDFVSTISRAKFEDINMDLFRQCFEFIEKAIRYSRISKASIDEVILVGGSTRIPKIQTMVSDFFGGKAACQSVDPETSVAYGASFIAGYKNSEMSTEMLYSDFLFLDANPFPIGIETEGGVMTTIIRRNTIIPLKKLYTIDFDDWQTEVRIKVFEGERSLTRDCTYLGTVTLDLEGISPLKNQNKQTIQVEFLLFYNIHRLEVTVRMISLDGNSDVSTMMEMKRGSLRYQDIQRMAQEEKKRVMED